MSISNINSVQATSPHADEQSDAISSRQDIRPRLLIVDDISDNRNILMRRFERRGFDVVEAELDLQPSS